ncbi:cytosine permease [Streptomyces sp. NPDC059639]|uniref:cytosine permease n=1 Tax=Streptomyces sp. NPDC059639 TaxID=3346891 RepID=UPI0036AEB768
MKTSDLIAIITSSSGVVGVIVLVSATLKINNWNLYSSVLGLINAVESLFKVRLGRVTTTVTIGVLGSLAAAAGILDHFTDFLTVLGVLTPPVAGIMVAEYFVVKKWRPQLDASRRVGRLPETEPSWVPATIALWVLASLVGWLADRYQWWGIPALDSLVLAGLGYVVLGRLGLVRGARELPVTQPLRPAAQIEAEAAL